MKKILLILLLCISVNTFAQRNGSKFGISLGTTLGTYAGADFGSAYTISFYNTRDYDRYNYNNSYYDDRNDNSRMSPMVIDLGIDFRFNDKMSVNLESAFIWHINGKPHRDYIAFISNNESYLEKWDNSIMYAVPIFLNYKLYPFGKKSTSFFISSGYGIQYIKESMDRVREDISSNNNNYYYGHKYIVASQSDSKWLHGIKLSIGINFNLTENISNETEIKITNFFPQRNLDSKLAMNSTTNITFVGLTSKIYFNF